MSEIYGSGRDYGDSGGDGYRPPGDDHSDSGDGRRRFPGSRNQAGYYYDGDVQAVCAPRFDVPGTSAAGS